MSHHISHKTHKHEAGHSTWFQAERLSSVSISRLIDVLPEKSEAPAVQLRNPQASAFNWPQETKMTWNCRFCLKLQCPKLLNDFFACSCFAVPTFMVNKGLILNLGFQDLHLPFSHKEHMCENLDRPRDENLNFGADWTGPRLGHRLVMPWHALTLVCSTSCIFSFATFQWSL